MCVNVCIVSGLLNPKRVHNKYQILFYTRPDPKKKTLAALVVECDTDTHINAKRPTDVRSERNYIEFALENAALFKYIFAFRGNLCKFGKLIKCGHCDVRIFVCVDGNIHKDTVI